LREAGVSLLSDRPAARAPALDRWLFPKGAAARQSRGHVTPACAPSSWNSSLRCTRSGPATPGTTVLALLALQRGKPVSADQLIEALWGDGQVANPVNALQAQIGQLRRTLGATTSAMPWSVRSCPGPALASRG
jgi:hypothetical protein